MSARLAGWIAVALALAVVISLFVAWLVFLAVPIAVVAMILVARYGKGYQERDLAEMFVSGAATLPGDRISSNGAQLDWGAALRAELASISVRR